MTNVQFALLDFFQVTSFDCWQRLSFYDTFWATTMVTSGIIFTVFCLHRLTPAFLSRCVAGGNDLVVRRRIRNSLVQALAMYMSLLYPSIALKSLSLWNCQTVGDVAYLVMDLSLPCQGALYQAATIFNIVFVTGVVVGWPLFLIWYGNGCFCFDSHHTLYILFSH